MLQIWLSAVSSYCIFDKSLCKFLSVDYNILLQRRKELTVDDYYVLEFLKNIQIESGNKLHLLKSFSGRFLTRRRSLNNDTIKRLLLSLFPLCAEEAIGGYALDFISKLTTREHYYEYEQIRKVFLSLKITDFKLMQLDNFLLKKRYSQGELQAYNLLSFLQFSTELNLQKENPQNALLLIAEIVRVI